jgi:parallel beta-helix repeat protein
MNKTNLLLVIIILSAAFFCASTGVASAISLSDKYVGNTVVDLEWTKYGIEDFSKYKLYRGDTLILTEFNRNITFYLDEGPSKGVTYDYKIEVYIKAPNGTIVLEDWATQSVTAGDVHGTITRDTTWTAASSPYNLTGSVIVEGYQNYPKLTIENGVTVNGGGVIYVDEYKEGTIAPLDSVTFNGVGISLESFHDYSIKNCVFNTGSGIALGNPVNCTISNNIIEHCGIGIYLHSHGLNWSCNNIVTNNTANYNGYGISLYSQGFSTNDNNILTNNTANYNGYGIYQDQTSRNILTSNTANYNGYGIYLSTSWDNTLTNNTANHNDNYGIFMDDSNTLTGNTANYNYKGIGLFRSSNNTLTSNTANNNNKEGIYLRYSSDNILTGNTANNNGDDGIYLDDSSDNNILTGNTANNNSNGIYLYGIYLSPSSDNTLTGNTANNNSDDGISLWYSSNQTTVTMASP